MKMGSIAKNIVIGTFLSLIITLPALAGMYRWVDDKGDTHYTQSPPPIGIEGKTIAPPPPPATPAKKQADPDDVNADEKTDEKTTDTAKGGKQESDKERDARHAAMIKENCKVARRNLASALKISLRINDKYIIDGVRRRYKKSERDALIQQANDHIATSCQQ